MNFPKALAAGLALNRSAFGLNYLARPEQARLAIAGASTLVGGVVAAAGLRPGERRENQAAADSR